MMEKRHVGTCVSVLGSAAALLTATTLAGNDAATVTVDTGVLRGVAEADVRTFKGIPYAAAPVGELRWRAPQPAAAWKGVRAATQFGAACLQPKSHPPLPAPNPVIPPVERMSEDCLTLNVWTPGATGGEKLPVMVWFHGGGFYMGSSSWDLYDGSTLAKDGVVVVTVNYRLGALGLFAHPALSAENPNGPVTNFALLDMIESLRWVKRNIAAFAGDPGNVTVFGESAGGTAVNLLMVSPLSNGLFHQAIAESAPRWATERRLKQSTPNLPSAEQWGTEWARKLGVGQDAKALRALPVETILANSEGMSNNVGFVIDGKSLTMSVMEAFDAGQQHKVPYMAGANDYEGGLLSFLGPSWREIEKLVGNKRDALLEAYDPDGTLGQSLVQQLIAGDSLMIRPSQYLARQAANSGLSGYCYVFSYVPVSVRPMVHGAWHGAEVNYVFGTLEQRHPAHGAPTAQDMQVSKQLRSYWVSFAKTGRPGHAGGPEWLPADQGSMVFGNDGGKFSNDYLKARLAVIGDQQNPLIP